jgi:spermidine/putrescine transport system ATP-binding protein
LTEGADVDIRLDGVWKLFGREHVAVRDLSLDIRAGEFFSLLGPSGCGKTTTLRLIAGFEAPTAGTIELQGRPVENLPPFRRNVNTVFQSYALFPHMTVARNVAYGLERKKVDKADVHRRVGDVLELVQLTKFADRRPEQLSGGQQQRVALARALVNYPAVLLLDEPLGALDLKLRKEMQIELARIQKDVGITFIYVTHDQEEALTMSDRMAVMNEGQLEQVGAPWDIYEAPATRFVAGFIGTSNVLSGTVREVVADGGERWARFDGPLADVRVRAGDAVVGDRVEFTIRPEKIEMFAEDAAPATDGRCVLDGVVTDLVYQGVSTQYLVRTPDDATLVVFAQNRRDAEDIAQAGDRVVCRWRPENNVVLVDRDKAVADASAAAVSAAQVSERWEQSEQEGASGAEVNA